MNLLLFTNIYYIDFHRIQCTEPTSLALDNFQHFSSNSTKFSVVIENAVGYRFLCKSLTRDRLSALSLIDIFIEMLKFE